MKKRLLSLLLALALTLSLGGVAARAADGDADTIYISSAEDLRALAEHCRLDTWSRGKTVELTCDLDLGMAEFTPIPTFGGVFHGNGHTIRGLNLSADLSHAGFFRYVQEDARVEDLRLEGSVCPAGEQDAVGGLCGVNYGALRGCSFSGTVSGSSNVGGLVGINEESGRIQRGSAAGTVSGASYTGGVVGYNRGTLAGCTNEAGVNTAVPDAPGLNSLDLDSLDLGHLNSTENVAVSTDTGGIAGYSSGTVRGCTNYGRVGYPHYGYNVGGIAGRQCGFLTGCANYGDISGRKEVGGIAGQMEPHLEVRMSSNLAAELQTLHDLVSQAVTDCAGEAEEITAALDAVHSSAGSAYASAAGLARQTTDLVSGTAESVNETARRIQTLIDGLAPVTRDLDEAMNDLSAGIDALNAALDTLELDEAAKETLRGHLMDLRSAQADQRAAADYLRYLAACGSGEDPDSARPDNWETAQAEYGYDYTVTEKKDLLLAAPKPIADLLAAAERAAWADAAILAVLDDYYLTPVFDTDGDGVPDQNRLEQAGEENAPARAAFGSAADALSGVTGGLRDLNDRLACLDPVELPKPDSSYYQTTDALLQSLSGISGGLSKLGGVIRSGSTALRDDILAVNDQFNRVMLLVVNAITGDTNEEILQDVSLEDTEETTEGKTADSVNYGAIQGDRNVGGVCGAQAIEYDYDLEGDLTSGLAGANKILSSTYLTRCVIRDCENRGSVTAKKDAAGGITGRMELGAVLDCRAYGTVESIDGGKVGGIAGLSYTVIRDSYAMCALSGLDHVGGIAGLGHDIAGCATLIRASEEAACTGAIAGEADGTLTDNCFVHETLGGVDGISYAGSAEPVSYDALCGRSGVPAEFRTLTLTFVADGEIVKTLRFAYGADLSEAELPEVPEKEGYTGSWPDYDYRDLRFSDTLTAEYVSQRTTVATDQSRPGDEHPLALAEGRFGPKASLLLTASEAEPPAGAEVLEQWVLRLTPDCAEEDTSHVIRYRTPETARRGAGVRLLVRMDGEWRAVSAQESGSYLVFEAEGDTVEFCAVETAGSAGPYLAAGLGGAALLGSVLLLGRKRRAAKKARAAAVKPEAGPLPEPSAPEKSSAPEETPAAPK